MLKVVLKKSVMVFFVFLITTVLNLIYNQCLILLTNIFNEIVFHNNKSNNEDKQIHTDVTWSQMLCEFVLELFPIFWCFSSNSYLCQWMLIMSCEVASHFLQVSLICLISCLLE